MKRLKKPIYKRYIVAVKSSITGEITLHKFYNLRAAKAFEKSIKALGETEVLFGWGE